MNSTFKKIRNSNVLNSSILAVSLFVGAINIHSLLTIFAVAFALLATNSLCMTEQESYQEDLIRKNEKEKYI